MLLLSSDILQIIDKNGFFQVHSLLIDQKLAISPFNLLVISHYISQDFHHYLINISHICFKYTYLCCRFELIIFK